MTSESPEQWLTREVGDLLDAGSVGLYELVWLLNGSDFQLADADKKAIAYVVTDSIVSSHQAQLYELSWPSGEMLNGSVELASRIASADTWPTEARRAILGTHIRKTTQARARFPRTNRLILDWMGCDRTASICCHGRQLWGEIAGPFLRCDSA